jgi:transcriptional regulator with XRE-family HTH domain
VGSPEGNETARALGAALRGHRMARGLSLRSLAKQVGLAAHGTLLDYEHGRRIPPEDLVVACEKALDLDDGQLRRLRLAALAERADGEAAALLNAPIQIDARPHDAHPDGTAPADQPANTRWPRRGHLWSGLAFVVALALTAIAITAFGPARGHPAPSPSIGQLHFGFESPDDRWGILWGPHKATGEVTDTMHYEGTRCYRVTTTGASQRDGYVAFGTTHGLESLHSGMRVTMHLWTSYPRNGVRFFVYNSRSKPVWAPETLNDGSEVPVSGGTEWSTLTWTVPPVDRVGGIGVQPYAENDETRVVAVDAVSW